MIISPSNILHFIASQKPELNIYGKAMSNVIEIEMLLETTRTRSLIVKYQSEVPIDREGNTIGHLFVKQPIDIFNKDQSFSIIREAFFYQACGNYKPLRSFLPTPKYFSFNEVYTILLREWIKDVVPFDNLNEIDKAKFLKNVGYVLGKFHDFLKKSLIKRIDTYLVEKLQSLKGGKPSLLLNIGEMDESFFRLNYPNLSKFKDDYISKECIKVLSRVNATWRTDNLIHSDIHGGNILVYKKKNKQKVHIIDWEYVVWGDIAWDVACVIYNLVLLENAEINSFTKEEIASQMQFFWKNYIKQNKGNTVYILSEEFKYKVRIYIAIKYYDRAFQAKMAKEESEEILRYIQQAESFILDTTKNYIFDEK